MPILDTKGFNQFQDEIVVIDSNLNDEIDPRDIAVSLQVKGIAKGERVPFHHPRYVELRDQYMAFLEAEEEERRL